MKIKRYEGGRSSCDRDGDHLMFGLISGIIGFERVSVREFLLVPFGLDILP